MTPDPKLMKVAKDICDQILGHSKNRRCPNCDRVALALQQHGDEQRNMALEEAAKVSEDIGNEAYKIALQATILKSQNTEEGIAIAGEMIAKCIRSLKRTP